ncbi:MAG: c-type cytochrome domain-containing protein [Kofleriaceae bacterium]
MTPLLRTILLSAGAATVAACAVPDDRPADWAYVHAAILEPSCATAACHAKLTARAGVDLSTQVAAYAVLVGRVCGAPVTPGDPIGNFVVPGRPESSRLMYQLRGDRTATMPPDRPLPDAEIAIIERWILEGATCE